MKGKNKDEALLKGKDSLELPKDEAMKAADVWYKAKRSGTIKAEPATKIVQ